MPHRVHVIRARRRRRQAQRGSAHLIVRWLALFLCLVFGLLLVGLGGLAALVLATYFSYTRDLPPPAAIEARQAQAAETTVLYDRTGQQVIYEILPPSEGDRQRISIYDLPPYVLEATVAIEDSSFYTNPGFDVRGIARALWANFTGGELQGGSSITQQLVKNVLLAPEERTDLSVDRKVKEIILASEISRLYSKDQILEWYLNTNFYGNLAYGIEAASRVYFNKSARDLTLGEATLLAAIPQFPLQNPIDNPEAARLRQELVLRRMVNLGYLTQAEAQAALAESIVIRPFGERFEITAPHFSLYARNEAEKLLNQLGYDGAFLVSRGGLRIYTTLDVDLQAQAECVALSHVTRLSRNAPTFAAPTAQGTDCTALAYLPPLEADLAAGGRRVSNAAVVVLRAETGEILTLLGSVNFWDATIDGNFNVATAERQPGSTFKPFVYLTAFLTPLDPSTIVTPATLLSDVRLEFNVGGQTYIPQNIDRQYHGPVSVRKALGNSYNIPTVQVLNWIGISPLLRTAHRMGINSLNAPLSAYGLSLALGAGEVTPLDLTYAYNVFATQGYAVGVPVHSSEARQGYRQLNPTSLLRIEDKNGRVLWEFSEAKGTFDRRLVIPQGMAYLMTDLLSDPEARLPSFPRGNPLELSRPAAAKTGTTDDNRDAWAVGYTPFYTTTVWVGNNDNTSMSDITGLTGAAPIWHALMEYLHLREGLPPTGWTRPTTVVEQTVCLWSGLLPTPNCPQVPRELFYVDPANGVDYRPQKTDNAWYRLAIDVCNNSRANDTTPPQCLEERIFFDFPPEFEAWAMANAPELIPPQQEGIIREGSAFSPVAIVAPRFPDQIRATVEIFGNTNLEDLNYYQIGYGEGNEPTAFIQIGQNGTTRGFNQALATWDTTGLTDGVYTLRLQVIRAGNRIETASTRVTVDNTPPEVRLISPLGGTQISFGQSGVLSLEAEVFDSGAVQRVEFYVDALDKAENVTEGIKIGESQTYPYSYVWALDPRALGTRTFWAVAYDRAGNATTSNRTSLTLAP